MEVWVAAANVADVALEVLHVDGVEADDGCVEANVLLSETVAEVVGTAGLGEVLLRTIEGFEKLGDGLLVGFLGTVGWHVSTDLGCDGAVRHTWQSQTCRHRC